MKFVTVQDYQGAPDGFLLDVRTPVEFEEIHIPGAMLHPLSNLDAGKVLALSDGRPVYLICRSGNRARQAAEKLENAGLRDVSVVQGGMTAWEAASLPVNRGRAAISLERQVRIVAGALVLIGVILGFTMHPAFYLLSGLVGAGLLFAGITDTCGMGLLLARMPWNKSTRSGTAGSHSLS